VATKELKWDVSKSKLGSAKPLQIFEINFDLPSPNSMVLRAAFSWISIALDQSLERTRLLAVQYRDWIDH
jgi:hypothetical protein